MRKLLIWLSALIIGYVVGAVLANASSNMILLEPHNTATFRGAVTVESSQEVMLKLHNLEKQRGDAKYPLYLVMDSPGGSVYAGLQFIDYAKSIRNLHTITIFAASMGHAIVQAIPGKRYVSRNGLLMSHRAKGGFRGQFEDGEVESQLRLWKSIIRNMELVASKRIGISLAKYKAKVKDEWWSLGQEAVTEGVADKVVSIVCSFALVDGRESITQRSPFGSSKLTFSTCPLFAAPIQEDSK